jgi:hypothetical protein
MMTKEVELTEEELGNGNDSSSDNMSVLSETPRKELGKGEDMNEVSVSKESRYKQECI